VPSRSATRSAARCSSSCSRSTSSSRGSGSDSRRYSPWARPPSLSPALLRIGVPGEVGLQQLLAGVRAGALAAVAGAVVVDVAALLDLRNEGAIAPAAADQTREDKLAARSAALGGIASSRMSWT
jgi:hypothetical protein